MGAHLRVRHRRERAARRRRRRGCPPVGARRRCRRARRWDLGRRLDGGAARRGQVELGHKAPAAGWGGAAAADIYSAGSGRAGGGESPRVPTRAAARRTAASWGALHFRPPRLRRRRNWKPRGRSEVLSPWLLGVQAGPRCSPCWRPVAPSAFWVLWGLSFSDEHLRYLLLHRRESAHLDVSSPNIF